MPKQNDKLNKAICCLVDCGAQFVDALDPALRAMAAKGIFKLAMWIHNMAKCCEPEPCPPLCPPPAPPPTTPDA
jgi:hypothetical protein